MTTYYLLEHRSWYQWEQPQHHDYTTVAGPVVRVDNAPGYHHETLNNWYRDCGFAINEHTDNLPPGYTWHGKYYPCITTNRGNQALLSEEAFPTPYQAQRRARELMAEWGLVVERYHFDFRSASCVFGDHPEYNLLSLMPEVSGGQISFSTSTTKAETVGRGCSNCGFIGHNSRTCSRQTRHYDKIGIEIEGRYFNLREVWDRASNAGLEYSDDSSIWRTQVPGGPQCQEFKTKPGLLCEALRQLEAFYPDEADASCGLHVHVSFRDPSYFTQLMTRGFYDYFKTRWLEWAEQNNLSKYGQFMQRLAGENDYCNLNTGDPSDPADGTTPLGDDRYRQLNFSAWHEHKTVECRLLPMFRDSTLAVAAVTELISIYEDWLSQAPAVFHETACGATLESPTELVESIDMPETHESEVVDEVEIPDLPPLSPDMRRVALTDTQIQHLLAMRIVA